MVGAGWHWQEMPSCPGPHCSSILLVVSLPGIGQAQSLPWGFAYSQWVFSLSSGPCLSANGPGTDWKKSEWTILCFLILAVSLWVFPKTAIWNKIWAVLRRVSMALLFSYKAVAAYLWENRHYPIGCTSYFCNFSASLCVIVFFWMKHILF